MKLKILTLILGVQAALSIASADSGKLTVVRSFNVVRTRSLNNPSGIDKSYLQFTPGTYNVEISSWSATDHDFCIPPFCADSSHEVPVVSFVLKSPKPDKYGFLDRIGSVDFDAQSTYVKDNTIAYYAQSSRQSFNMFSKTTESLKKVNQRTETQECEVKDHCFEGGGYGYGGFGGGYYGERCDYAVGTQTVLVHDEITTTVTKKQLTGASNQLLATFNGSEDSEPERVVDKEGVCKLNVPH